MGNLLSHFINRKYFIIEAVAVILVATFLIWLFTPIGGYISNFISPERATETINENANVDSSLANKQTFEATSIEIQTDVTPENIDDILNSIRDSRGLRSLTNLESDKNIIELPLKTYFYMAWVYLSKAPPFYNDNYYQDVVGSGRAIYKSDRPHSDYEIHYVDSNELYLLAYLSADSASSIGKLNGLDKKTIMVSPYPFDNFNTLASIPIDRILEGRSREIEAEGIYSIMILDLTIQ